MIKRLTREDWAWAALHATVDNGVAGINIDRLASELGATKGSLYHHFSNRDSLIDAALEVWENDIAQAFDGLDEIKDPRERLRRTVLDIVDAPEGVLDRTNGFIDVALAISPDEPRVRRVVQRVTRLRLAFLTRLLIQSGLEPALARDRAEEGLASYYGLYCYLRLADQRPSVDRAQRWLLETTMGMFDGPRIELDLGQPEVRP